MASKAQRRAARKGGKTRPSVRRGMARSSKKPGPKPRR